MKIETMGQLEALVRMCRKIGVFQIEVEGMKLVISEQPKRARKGKTAPEASTEPTVENMSESDLLFWSASTPTEEGF